MKTKKGIIKKRLLQLQGGRTLRVFADQLGIGQSTLHNYLKGRIPKADFIALVSIKCGVDARWLLGLVDVGSDKTDATVKAAAFKMHLEAQINETQKLIKQMEV